MPEPADPPERSRTALRRTFIVSAAGTAACIAAAVWTGSYVDPRIGLPLGLAVLAGCLITLVSSFQYVSLPWRRRPPASADPAPYPERAGDGSSWATPLAGIVFLAACVLLGVVAFAVGVLLCLSSR